MTVLENAALREKLMEQFHIKDCFESMTGLNFELVNFSSDEYMVREGEGVDCIYFLLVGRVKLYACSVKRDFGIIFMNSGLIGDSEFVTGRAATRSAQVVGDALCMKLSTRTSRHRLMSDRTFLRYLAQQLAEKLTLSETTPADAGAEMSTEERLYDYLKLSAEDGRITESLGTISQIMGVSYRHLIRMMNSLVDEGKIRHGKRKGAYFIA
ncbi:MAG: cyclic nucleotide-binding domain-containing protein [Lachnospiraceae bacterium]|nr:cyclic nucleotide-binding domain-containing protein [Lachnospiraceae bacterium]